jgi:D-3-phosphoglycerate dehydrogenase
MKVAIVDSNITPNFVGALMDRFEVTYLNTSGMKPDEETLKLIVKDVDGVIAGTEEYTAAVLKSVKNLKVISRVGTGTDNIDMDAAKELGITVVTTGTTHVEAVAEHAVALMFSAAKHIPQYNSDARHSFTTAHRFTPPGPQRYLGEMVHGKSVFIIGMGKVGRRIAEMLAPFKCPISYSDPKVNIAKYTKRTLLAGVRFADIIFVCASHQKGDPPILTKTEFEACNGAILINVSRGDNIDEEALEAALKSGKIESAALDVCVEEPYGGPLLHYVNVIATPHVATFTRETREEMERTAAENLIKELEK